MRHSIIVHSIADNDGGSIIIYRNNPGLITTDIINSMPYHYKGRYLYDENQQRSVRLALTESLMELMDAQAPVLFEQMDIYATDALTGTPVSPYKGIISFYSFDDVPQRLFKAPKRIDIHCADYRTMGSDSLSTGYSSTVANIPVRFTTAIPYLFISMDQIEPGAQYRIDFR